MCDSYPRHQEEIVGCSHRAVGLVAVRESCRVAESNGRVSYGLVGQNTKECLVRGVSLEERRDSAQLWNVCGRV